MLKFAVLLVLLTVFFRWALGRWPWEYARGPDARGQAIFRARKLLSVEEGANREQIIAAHRRLVAMVHPDKGGSNAQMHEANDARDVLLAQLPDRGIDPDLDKETDNND